MRGNKMITTKKSGSVQGLVNDLAELYPEAVYEENQYAIEYTYEGLGVAIYCKVNGDIRDDNGDLWVCYKGDYLIFNFQDQTKTLSLEEQKKLEEEDTERIHNLWVQSGQACHCPKCQKKGLNQEVKVNDRGFVTGPQSVLADSPALVVQGEYQEWRNEKGQTADQVYDQLKVEKSWRESKLG